MHTDTDQFKVQGRFPGGWYSRTGNMAITVNRTEQSKPATNPVGRLRGQTAQAAVMSSLHQLCMLVLSVECLDHPEEKERRKDNPSQRGLEHENTMDHAMAYHLPSCSGRPGGGG